MHSGNLIPTRSGLLWNDFEEVCRGPAAWDLATIGDEQVVRDLVHDPVRLATCRQLRGAQVAIVLLLLRDVFGTEPGWDDGIHWALELVGP